MITKTLGWKEFAAMAPEEKLARWKHEFRTALQPHIDRYRDYSTRYHARDYVKLKKRTSKEPHLRGADPNARKLVPFDASEVDELCGLLEGHRRAPWLDFARTPTSILDPLLPQNAGEHLLELMQKYRDLVFGYKDPTTARFQPGIVARWEDFYRNDHDSLDRFLVEGDFHGMDMCGILALLQKNGMRDVSRDFVETRIKRLFLTPAEIH